MRRSDLNLEDILTDKVVEEDLVEVPLADGIFRAFFVFAFLVVLLVLGRLVFFSLIQHDVYAKRALANMSDTKVQPAPRGIIFDRFGNPLVYNAPSFNAFLQPRFLPADTDGRNSAIDRIASILKLDAVALRARIAGKDWNVSDTVPLSDDVAQEVLVELTTADIPGVKIESSFKRVHEEPFSFSHVIGYTGLVADADMQNDTTLSAEDTVGRAGLEASYDTYLRGTNGADVVFRNARGEPQGERVVRRPEAGHDVHTTIDAELETYLYKRLTQALAELGREVAVGIALDPRNGEVLALVNVPGFDSSNLAPYLTKPTKPIFNRAVSGLYNPGSTIKPIVAIGALEEGVIDPLKQILSTGYIELPNPYDPEHPSRFLDSKPQGWVDVRAALAKSSNVYFYEVGGGFEDQPGLGIERLKKWWQRFRLDAKTGIDLTDERAGFLPDPAWKEKETGEPWRIGDTYNVSIGQGDLLVTPLSLLNAISAIANGGTLYQPRVVTSVTDAKDSVLFKSVPTVTADLTNEIADTLPAVREGMRDVVAKEYGSAYMMHGLPIKVAGKTGTAQFAFNQKVNAFFVGFAPYDDPSLALIILVENAREGSLNTLPVANDVFLWYYKNRIQHNAE
jgi:penicillin-binding protein 2